MIISLILDTKQLELDIELLKDKDQDGNYYLGLTILFTTSLLNRNIQPN